MDKDDVYDWKEAFDKKLTALDKIYPKPLYLCEAAVEVHEGVKLAYISAKAIFGETVDPRIAIDIYDRLEARRAILESNFIESLKSQEA